MNVFQYFASKLGIPPNDESLRDLDCDTPCGRDCVGAIDWTAECLERINDFPSPRSQRRTLQMRDDAIAFCNESCEVYWRG